MARTLQLVMWLATAGVLAIAGPAGAQSIDDCGTQHQRDGDMLEEMLCDMQSACQTSTPGHVAPECLQAGDDYANAQSSEWSGFQQCMGSAVAACQARCPMVTIDNSSDFAPPCSCTVPDPQCLADCDSAAAAWGY